MYIKFLSITKTLRFRILFPLMLIILSVSFLEIYYLNHYAFTVDEKELKAIRKSLNICTVVMGVCTLGIGLLWCIPIRKKILNRIDRREPVSNGLKIAATWVGMIPGLLLLVNEDI